MVVAAVRIDGYRNLIEAVDGPTVRSLLDTIARVADETFDHDVWFVDFGRDHGAIVHAPQTPVSSETIKGPYEKVIERVRSTLRVSVTIGIGKPTKELAGLVRSYQTALDTTQFRFRHGPGKVLVYGADTEVDAAYRLPDENLRRLLEEFRLGHTDRVAEVVNQIFGDVTQARYLDFRFTLELIVRTIRLEIVERLEHSTDGQAALRKLEDTIEPIDTVEEARTAISRVLSTLSRSIEMQRRNRSQAIIREIERYVENNLTNVALNSEMVADHVGLSTNYVRDLFRQTAGGSLPTMIAMKRIERAKEHLAADPQPVKVIAYSVGFQSYNYFFTIFKRETGMTPKEYQRTHRRTPE